MDGTEIFAWISARFSIPRAGKKGSGPPGESPLPFFACTVSNRPGQVQLFSRVGISFLTRSRQAGQMVVVSISQMFLRIW